MVTKTLQNQQPPVLPVVADFRIETLIAPLLAIAAGCFYWLTLSVGAFPGESARLIAQYTGLSETATTLNPLWGWVVQVLAGGRPQDARLS